MVESMRPNFPRARVSFVVSSNDDGDLVERSLRGNAEAFRPLVERYQKVLFTVALRMLGDREDALDAAQSAFAKAYEKLPSYDRRHKFFSWLYRILVNECLNVRRAQRERAPLDPELAGPDNPQRSAALAQLRTQVQAALAQLSKEQREVIVLRHFAEMSYEEIEEALAIPEKTVKSRLYEARQRLGPLLHAWKGTL
jgi:RNA polymerase sigma-70 factor (ECF subfamily)